MDFAWTVTENKHSEPPDKSDAFLGYFTDIQRAARKSLPKKPSKELCDILGLNLPTSRLEKEASFVAITGNDDENREPVIIPPTNIVPDNQVPKKSIIDKTLSMLPCSDSLSKYSGRERTIIGLSIYFAIVILLLLIVVIILSVTLTSQADNNESGGIVRLGSHSSPSTHIPSQSAPTSSNRHGFTSTSTPVNISTLVSSTSTIHSTERSSSLTTSKSVQTRSEIKTTETATKTKTTTLSGNLSTTRHSTQKSTGFTSSVSAVSVTTRRDIKTTDSTTAFKTTKPPDNKSTSFSRLTPTKSTELPQSTASKGTSLLTTPLLSSRFSTRTVPVTAFSSRKSTTYSSSSVQSKSTALSTSSKPKSNLTSLATVSTIKPVSTKSPDIFPKLRAQTVAETCLSPDCQAAREAIDMIDFDTSPCVDFYQFACGGWAKETQSSMQTQRVGTISFQEELRRTLLLQIKDILTVQYSPADSFAGKISKRLYQSCMETNQNQNESLVLQELHRIVDPLGMTENGNIGRTVPSMLSKINIQYEYTPLFKTELSPVKTENGNNVYGLKVSPPTLNLDRSLYRTNVDTNEITSDYVAAMANILYTYTSSFTSDDLIRRRKKRQATSDNRLDYAQAFERALQVYYIEANISQILDEVIFEGVKVEEVRETSVPELLDTDFNIPWDFALGVSDASVKILLVSPDFFSKLDVLLGKLNTNDVTLYIFMNTMMHRVWPYLPFSLRKDLRYAGGELHVRYTDLDCLEKALHLAKEEIHGLYVGQYTKSVLESRIQLINTGERIRVTFQQLVASSAWMKSDLKRVAAILMKNMRPQFSTVSSSLRLTNRITGETQSFLSVAREIHGQLFQLKLQKLGVNVTVENLLDWTSLEVIYDLDTNVLGLPTGLGAYFLNGNEPLFKVHGGIGKLMAEKMIKVLTGELSRGMAPAWWGQENLRNFDNISACFADQQTDLQLSNYDYGNVIIANGGFQLIKQVFSSSDDATGVIAGTNLTHDVLFYLNTAQVYCTTDTTTVGQRLLQQRVNNIMKNQGNMETLFSCPAQSPLVTQKKCFLL